MTQIFCDLCKRPLGVNPNEPSSFIANLCPICEKNETLKDSSILNYWCLLEVGINCTASNPNEVFTCEIVKAKPAYVVVAVTPEDSPCASTFIMLTKSYDGKRINMLEKDRYSYGYGSRDFVIQLLSQIAEKERLSVVSKNNNIVESIFWEAIETVYPI
ncbi:MAG: hypothetical protein ACTSO7_13700 [Candidatus Heimdallarchaeota archaeon]